MRRRWWHKVRRWDPPVALMESAYALEGTAAGQVVFIVAPGPSLAAFPVERLNSNLTVAVNASLELMQPTYWVFQEGTFCKRYHKLYTGDQVDRIVTTTVRANWIRPMLPQGKVVYHYNRDPSIKEHRRKEPPHWYSPHENFLPGRNTIAATAISLAALMRPRCCVLLGVDFAQPKGKYYVDGVHKNPGPRLRTRALAAGRAWVQYAIRRGAWRGLKCYTTSPWLRLPRLAERITVEQALDLTA